ncbi:HK97 family phage prohead protease [Streptomyces sp. NPDC005953]|uniref:HK97 family phage prohead protease n=1 Tax=Streptomyces sp. NPDC005953 TaxID=3156719 RepID=UPI00340FB0E0
MPAMHPAARDLERSAPFLFHRSDEDDGEGDGRTLAGYAAVFGQDTEIDSWEGRFVETIRKGAFKKTIRESVPVMQFDHGRHPLIGSLPIGSITDLREDDQGLHVEGRISDNWLMEPVRDAIAEGSVNGMSFRFEVVREEWRDANNKLVKPEEVLDLLWMPGDRGPLRRELIEIRCRELGPVVFPAYAGTSISVRARDMAAGLVHNDDVTRRIRQSLARDAAVPQVSDDPELRREVAAALLFGDEQQASPANVVVNVRSGADPAEIGRAVRQAMDRARRGAAPPIPGHPADLTTDGAPLDREHPPVPSITDAPPLDGHPSPDPDTARRKAHINEVRGLMRGVLESIENKDM